MVFILIQERLGGLLKWVLIVTTRQLKILQLLLPPLIHANRVNITILLSGISSLTQWPIKVILIIHGLTLIPGMLLLLRVLNLLLIWG